MNDVSATNTTADYIDNAKFHSTVPVHVPIPTPITAPTTAPTTAPATAQTTAPTTAPPPPTTTVIYTKDRKIVSKDNKDSNLNTTRQMFWW